MTFQKERKGGCGCANRCALLVTIMKYPHSGGNQFIKKKRLLGLIILEISSLGGLTALGL